MQKKSSRSKAVAREGGSIKGKARSRLEVESSYVHFCSNLMGNMRTGVVITLCYTVHYLGMASGFSTLSVTFSENQKALLPSTLDTRNSQELLRKNTAHRTNARTSACVLSALNNNEDDNEEDEEVESQMDLYEQESDISWLKNAMSKDIPSESLSTNERDNYSPKLRKFESGLAGFAVDPDLGFVCILLGEEPNPDKFTFAIMSPTDIDNISSAEALCLVQLAGGLDLGAAVLPPEALARIVSEALDESDEDAETPPFDNVEALRPRVSLIGVSAKNNENYTPNNSLESAKSKDYRMINQNAVATPSAARDEAIKVSAPKILSAVKNLPGLGKVTLPEVVDALKLHSDSEGNLNREEFSQVLGTLRYELSRTVIKDQKVKFQLTVSISSDSNDSKDASKLKLLNIDDVPAFLAVALSLRYKVKISVPNDCLSHQDHDQKNVMDRFPAFKPIQELVKDAQSISGSISSMFFNQSAPKNDDKS